MKTIEEIKENCLKEMFELKDDITVLSMRADDFILRVSKADSMENLRAVVYSTADFTDGLKHIKLV